MNINEYDLNPSPVLGVLVFSAFLTCYRKFKRRENGALIKTETKL